MFRASMCPSSGEKLLYLCDTGICHSVCVASGLLVGLKLIETETNEILDFIREGKF